MPNPRNYRAAKFALIFRQIIGGNNISLPLDQQFFTVMAVGIVARVAGHIADIDVMQALLQGQFAIAGQGGYRGGGQAVQFVTRKKCRG